MIRERLAFIDILKGVAILMVVYCHIIPGVCPGLTEYISTFHMPLFFFVSGMLFNNEKYRNNFKAFIYNRTRGLLIPFLYFSIIVSGGYYFIEKDYTLFLLKIVKNGWGGYALWFIPVLIMSELIYYPFSRISLPLVRFVCLVGLAGCSYISSRLIGLLPYNLLMGLGGAFFFGMGNFVNPAYFSQIKKIDWKIVSVLLLCFLFSLIALIPGQRPEWFINKIPSLIYYVAPLGAILSLLIVSFIIGHGQFRLIVNFFSTCGRYSYIILAFHQIICMIAQLYVSSKVAILILIILLAFLVWFIPKYIPWMLGKTKK